MITSGGTLIRLERWLSVVLLGPSAPPGGARLALQQVSVDGDARLLQDFEVSEPPSREYLRELADKIDQEAREDAESLGWTSQQYRVDARDRQGGKQVGSLALRYMASTLALDAPGFGALPNPGQRGQGQFSMNQIDNAYKTLILGIGMAFDQMNRSNMRTENILDKMSHSITRTFDLMEEAAERRSEREALAAAEKQKAELSLKQEEAKIERERMLLDAGINHLAPIIPILVNRLAGGAGSAPSTTSRDELMASLIGSISPEQEDKLRSMLSDVQLATLVELDASLAKLKAASSKTATSDKTTVDQTKQREAQIVQAVDYVKETLLPWAVERLRKGDPVDPKTHGAEAARLFGLLLRSLPDKEFAILVGESSPLGLDQRKAFKAMAEAMKASAPPATPAADDRAVEF